MNTYLLCGGEVRANRPAARALADGTPTIELSQTSGSMVVRMRTERLVLCR